MAERLAQQRRPPALGGVAEIVRVEPHHAQQVGIDMRQVGLGLLSRSFPEHRASPSDRPPADRAPCITRPIENSMTGMTDFIPRTASELFAAMFSRHSSYDFHHYGVVGHGEDA